MLCTRHEKMHLSHFWTTLLAVVLAALVATGCGGGGGGGNDTGDGSDDGSGVDEGDGGDGGDGDDGGGDDGNPVEIVNDVSSAGLHGLPTDIDVLSNDDWGDNGSDGGSVRIIGQPQNGSVAVDTNETPNDPTDDFIVYTPPASYPDLDSLREYGSDSIKLDSFSYELEDVDGETDTGGVDIYLDVDQDADGLIEIASLDNLKNVGAAPDGSSLLYNGTAVSQGCSAATGCFGYEMLADIDVSGNVWEPIANSEEPFTGIFDGNGHTVNGLTFHITDTDDLYNAGFFDALAGASIKNLTLDSVRVDVEEQAALRGDGESSYIGGLAGVVDASEDSDTDVTNVDVTTEVHIAGGSGGPTEKYYIGGITGDGNQLNVSDSTVNLTIIYQLGAGYRIFVGGITHWLMDGTVENSNISTDIHQHPDYLDYSDPEVAGGGVVGDAYDVLIGGSTVTTDIVSEDPKAALGGVVGEGQYLEIYSTSAEVWIYGHYFKVGGGIVGQMDADSVLRNVQSSGRVMSSNIPAYENAYFGGIVGNNSGGVVANCVSDTYASTPRIDSTGSPFIGGIAGLNAGAVRRCLSLNDVVANTNYDNVYLGGLVGGQSFHQAVYTVPDDVDHVLEYSYWNEEAVTRIDPGQAYGHKNLATTTGDSYLLGLIDGTLSELQQAITSGRSRDEFYAYWLPEEDANTTTAKTYNLYCDTNGDYIINEGEMTDDNLAWDLGTTADLPTLQCLPQ